MKKIAQFVVLALIYLFVLVLFAPVLLIITEGPDGGITIWNFVGIAYALAWVAVLSFYERRRKHG
ncbi:MAG: hypothetical protein IJ528_07285 [Bacteroidaceae bacterium]|nr:hypothetical protein [Bacteroidaceae bacterium]